MNKEPNWEAFLDFFQKNNKGSPVILSVLRQLRALSFVSSSIILECANHGVYLYVKNKEALIKSSLELFFKQKITLSLHVKETSSIKEKTPLLAYEPSVEDLCLRCGIRPTYRFENYAVSESNNVAYAASQSVAKSPGHSYNPLFLYGGVGVGKTHLAQSICRVILENNSSKRVYFCPGDQFMNELIEAIREHTTPRFRKKYRHLDTLAIDDVQFIGGKQTMQEELFHTFNAIVSSGGQIILVSDRPPHEIKGLEDRLRSRFSGGLLVDIQPPDFELRTAIILIKAKEKNIEIDIEVAKIIADKTTDTRALEGILLSIYASTLGRGGAVGIEDVERFFDREKNSPLAKRLTHHDIIRAVCLFFNVRPSHIRSPSRTNMLVLPRQIIMYLLRKELGLTYEEIASILKRKDHTTIMHGFEKTESSIMKNPLFKQQIDNILQSITPST